MELDFLGCPMIITDRVATVGVHTRNVQATGHPAQSAVASHTLLTLYTAASNINWPSCALILFTPILKSSRIGNEDDAIT